MEDKRKRKIRKRGRKEAMEKVVVEKRVGETRGKRERGFRIDSYWKRFNVSCTAVAETGDEQNRADATIYVNSLSTGC